jgi:hypothetical protein
MSRRSFATANASAASGVGTILAVNGDTTPTLSVGDAASVLIAPIAAAAAAGITLVAEGRIGPADPWLTLNLMPTNTTNYATRLAATAAISALPAFGWWVPICGYTEFRVRRTAGTAGSVTVRVALSDVVQ